MCSRCKALDQYAPAMAKLVEGVGMALDTKPDVVTPSETSPVLAAFFHFLATTIRPDRDPKLTGQYLATLPAATLIELHKLSETMVMVNEAGAQVLAMALKALGVEIEDQDDDDDQDATPDDLDIMALLERAREADGADEVMGERTTGQAAFAIPMQGLNASGKREEVEKALAEFSKKLAEITGAPVTVGSMTEGRDGKLRKTGETVTLPGAQFPMPSDKTLH